MDIIKGRRSVRNYQEKAIPEAALNQILASVQWSPSWANTQCWEVIVITSPDVRQRLQEMLPKTNPATKHFAEAPVTLALVGKLERSGYYKEKVTTKFGDWFMFDLGIAAQSICLTAHALGIGTVIVGLFDHSSIAAELGVPEGYELVALIPMGYPAKTSGAPKRREIKEFTHENRF